MRWAELTKTAFTSAAEGLKPGELWRVAGADPVTLPWAPPGPKPSSKYWRTRRASPDRTGVDIDVPCSTWASVLVPPLADTTRSPGVATSGLMRAGTGAGRPRLS